MNLLEGLKHLPEDLAAAIRRVTESGDAEVSVEPGLEIKMKLVIVPWYLFLADRYRQARICSIGKEQEITPLRN